MINSTSSQQGTLPTSAIDLSLSNGAARSRSGPGDQLSTAGAELLKAKLASEPEIRPDVVARGRTLAANPDYPTAAIIGSVASKILQAPDPSEDLS